MIEIVSQGRDEIIRGFACSRRLATRVGALLAKGIALSATVMEEARPGTLLEGLLLSRELLDAEDPAHALGVLLSRQCFSPIGSQLPLVLVGQGDFTVLAAEEEILAEKGFTAAEGASPGGVAARLPTLADDAPPPNLLQPGPGASPGAAPAFSPAEVARLRVTVFAGAGSEERVAALRQFAYVSIPPRDKEAVFLQAMADPLPELRAAAAQGLRMLGLHPAVAEAARLLAEGAEEEKRIGAERLRDLVPASADLERDAAAMALLGALRDAGSAAEPLCRVLEIVAGLAGSLGPERLCREDVLRVLLERRITGKREIFPALRQALAAIDKIQPGLVTQHLLAEIRQSQSDAYRAPLLEILSSMPMAAGMRGDIIDIAAAAMISAPTDSDTCRVLGQFLVGSGDAGLLELAARIVTADTAHQRHLVRVLDNALRSRAWPAAVVEASARAGLVLLQRAPRQVRSDIAETHICSRDDLPEDMRKDIAEALLKDLGDYGRWPLADVMEAALARLGAPASMPLLRSLHEHAGGPEAAIVAGALGRIGMAEAASGQTAAGVHAESILRELQKLSFAKGEIGGHLHLAMGRICSQPGIRADIGALIINSLLSRLAGGPEDGMTIEALGLACQGPGADEEKRRTVGLIALNHLRANVPDPVLAVASEQGEEVFRLSGGLDVYARLLPCCLAAIQHLVMGQATTSQLRGELVEALLERWEKVVSLQVQWGPANTALLTTVLGRIAAGDAVSQSQRIRISNMLARQALQVSALSALAGILERADPVVELDRLAARLLLRLLKIIEGDRQITREDREVFLGIMGRIGRRGRFSLRGGGEDRLVERVILAQLAGLQQGIPGCSASLASLRDCERLPERLRESIRGELARFTSIAVRAQP